jgi:hypothetical protein
MPALQNILAALGRIRVVTPGDGHAVRSFSAACPDISPAPNVEQAIERAEASALRVLTGGNTEPHWMVVTQLEIVDLPNGGKGVRIQVHSWGKMHSHPGLPLAEFLANFEGFVAASPLDNG